MSEKQRTVLLLRTGSFQTRDNKDLGLVHINFAHDEFDILEEWATYIEFARAKAIYDDFVNTFGKISFPLQSEQRMIKKEKALRKKIKNKIENSQMSLSININMKENKVITDSMKDFGAANVSYLKVRQQNLKESLMVFINHGLLLFLSNIIEKAPPEQNKEKQINLGKNNIYVKKFPNFLKIKPNLFEDEEENQNNLIDNNLAEVFPGKKKSVSIDLKSINFNRIKSSKSTMLDNDENIDEAEEKANIPSESINSHLLRSRIKSSSSDLQQSSIKSSIQEKSNNNNNNTNKIFTFNSTVSLDLPIDNNKKVGSIELPRNSSQGGILSTPRLNSKFLSQIQEEEFENDQKMWNFQKGEYKLKGNTKRKYRFFGKEPEVLMPPIFYSRKNSVNRKNRAEEKGKTKKRKRRIIVQNKTMIYKEVETEKKRNPIVSNVKPLQVPISRRGSSLIKKNPSYLKESPNMRDSSEIKPPSQQQSMHKSANLSHSEKKKMKVVEMMEIEDIDGGNDEENSEIVKIRNNESKFREFNIFFIF